MRFLIALSVFIWTVPTLSGQSGPSVDPYELLRLREPKITWNATNKVAGDFNHDGLNDYAVSGVEEGLFVLGIVRGPLRSNSRLWILRFSVALQGRAISELCSIKATLRTRSPVILGSKKRLWKIPSASKGIVVDDGCDPVHVSWHQDMKRFEMMRIHIDL